MLKRLVVLTGAGISAESGIKTFRDSDGLWENYRIEDVCTHDAWLHNTKVVIDFYNQRRKELYNTKPNAAHVDNNEAVRNMLLKRGIQPENLPPAEDVKKIQRKLDSDDKKVLKESKKSRKK